MEQSAFNPANVVPVIGFSPDKMLQERLFSSRDAQRRYRLGLNHHQIPLNAPCCAYNNYISDAIAGGSDNHALPQCSCN